MSKLESYREQLASLGEWEPFLMTESRLPGPRANLELLQAVIDMGDAGRFERLRAHDDAPENTPPLFLLVCGVAGLGKLLAQGDRASLPLLKGYAEHRSWRVREAVCIALQRWGDTDMDALLTEMRLWSRGSLLQKRAAAAALCEPRLLTVPAQAGVVLAFLDEITAGFVDLPDRRGDDFRTLRKALGYCWSVAVVAHPEIGRPLMEKWIVHPDRDICWIMRENLRKDRLKRLDAAWVEACLRRLGG